MAEEKIEKVKWFITNLMLTSPNPFNYISTLYSWLKFLLKERNNVTLALSYVNWFDNELTSNILKCIEEENVTTKCRPDTQNDFFVFWLTVSKYILENVCSDLNPSCLIEKLSIIKATLKRYYPQLPNSNQVT